MRAANPTRAALAGLCLVAAAGAAGCAPSAAESVEVRTDIVSTNPELATDPSVPVLENLSYGSADGAPLLLDACLPPGADPASDAARPAIVLVHGGSWARGSKSAIAWREGRVVFKNAPLAEVVRDMNRYLPTPLRLADDRAGRLRVSASFSLDRPEALVDALPAVAPVRLTPRPDGAIDISAK